MYKELPFKHAEEPKGIDEGSESRVLGFKPEKGKEYVFKEVYSDFALGRYKGETLESKAAEMKIVFDILKKHYGDKIAQTYFVIGKDEDNESRIIKIQEKIEGDSLHKLKLKYDDLRLKKEFKQVQEIEDSIPEVISEIKKHPRFKDYSVCNIETMVFDVSSSSNIIVDKDGNITVIDW